LISFLPLATTALAVLFARALFLRWRSKREAAHLLWWAVGVACYGLGTALEGTIALAGSSVALVKAWYVAGAILGAWPLAQGSAFLLSPRTARRLMWAVLPVVVAAAVLALVSPVDASRLEPRRPSAALLAWSPARVLPPLINVYAALLLVGGAALSAVRFAVQKDGGGRALGNALIALGALLPAIGGTIARHGGVEPLYVSEFLGLCLIGMGYRICIRSPTPVQELP